MSNNTRYASFFGGVMNDTTTEYNDSILIGLYVMIFMIDLGI
jgi:hypothetical protein